MVRTVYYQGPLKIAQQQSSVTQKKTVQEQLMHIVIQFFVHERSSRALPYVSSCTQGDICNTDCRVFHLHILYFTSRVLTTKEPLYIEVQDHQQISRRSIFIRVFHQKKPRFLHNKPPPTGRALIFAFYVMVYCILSQTGFRRIPFEVPREIVE